MPRRRGPLQERTRLECDRGQNSPGDEDRRAFAVCLHHRAVLGGAKPSAYDALKNYGVAIREAFQIADDLLDVEGDAAVIGKATGKDAGARKATFVSLLGVDGARKQLKNLVEDAEKPSRSSARPQKI